MSMDGMIPDINNSQELWGVDPAVTIVVVIKIYWHLDYLKCSEDLHGDPIHINQVHPVQQEDDEDLRHLLIQRADTGDPYRLSSTRG